MVFKKKTSADLRRKEDLQHGDLLLRQLFERVREEVRADIHYFHDKNRKNGKNASIKVTEEKLIRVIPQHLKLK